MRRPKIPGSSSRFTPSTLRPWPGPRWRAATLLVAMLVAFAPGCAGAAPERAPRAQERGKPASEPPRTAAEPVKVFSLQRPNADPRAELPELKDSQVYGVSWRFHWRTIEPAEGQYQWAPIDQALETTGRAGKKAMLRVTAGINSPEWVYQAGAKSIAFSNRDLHNSENFAKDLRMPVPWDDVFLAKWLRFVQALGARYQRHPSLYSVQMTGGGHIGEMNLPKAPDKWKQLGFSDERLISAWKRIIDAYQQAFPGVPTNLDINEPMGRKQSNVLEPVVAYVLKTYPGKVYLQNNGLRADFPRDNHIRRRLREAASTTSVGYQMLGGKGFLDDNTGDRRRAFAHAVEDRASYVEIYAADLRDASGQRALEVLGGARR